MTRFAAPMYVTGASDGLDGRNRRKGAFGVAAN
ncbi:MAG: hypothetical protein ACJAZO_001529 [Myxococcota bacterium]|jgi:hypothetical protein